jgi:hypothetical protein
MRETKLVTWLIQVVHSKENKTKWVKKMKEENKGIDVADITETRTARA